MDISCYQKNSLHEITTGYNKYHSCHMATFATTYTLRSLINTKITVIMLYYWLSQMSGLSTWVLSETCNQAQGRMTRTNKLEGIRNLILFCSSRESSVTFNRRAYLTRKLPKIDPFIKIKWVGTFGAIPTFFKLMAQMWMPLRLQSVATFKDFH